MLRQKFPLALSLSFEDVFGLFITLILVSAAGVSGHRSIFLSVGRQDAMI
jgi:hypothetical protein